MCGSECAKTDNCKNQVLNSNLRNKFPVKYYVNASVRTTKNNRIIFPKKIYEILLRTKEPTIDVANSFGQKKNINKYSILPKYIGK